jgi:hypothetical protein
MKMQRDFAFQKLRRDPFNIRGDIKPKTTKHESNARSASLYVQSA